MQRIWDRRTVRSAAVGSAGLVVGGMLFWGLLAPLGPVFSDTPLPAEVAEALAGAETPTGTYFHPWPRSDPDWAARHALGPFFRLHYVRRGTAPDSPAKLAIGTLHNAAIALLAAALVSLAAPATRGRAAALVLLAGAMGTGLGALGDPVWFHVPWRHALGEAVYEAGCWAVLAAANAGGRLRLPPGDPASQGS